MLKLKGGVSLIAVVIVALVLVKTGDIDTWIEYITGANVIMKAAVIAVVLMLAMLVFGGRRKKN